MTEDQIKKIIIVLEICIVLLGGMLLGGVFVYNQMINKCNAQTQVLNEYNAKLDTINQDIINARKECNTEFKQFWRENLNEVKASFNARFQIKYEKQ